MTENRVQTAMDEENSLHFRLYNLLIIVIDVIIVHLKMFYYNLETLYLNICPPEKTDVSDKIILITGTAHGIGKEIALQYGSLGARVVCWDVNEKGNHATIEEIKSRGGKAFSYVCDVQSRENVLEVADRVKKEVGRVDIIVNNAGIMPCHPLLEHTEEEINKLFGINVFAHFWIIQAFLPDMIERQSGHIVALSSCAGLFGLKNLVPYCGTKFAVRGVMQSLHDELRRDSRAQHIKLTTVYPYMVNTGLCKKPHMRFPNLMKLVEPEDVARILIDAQQRGIEEVTCPEYYFYVERIGRLLPKKSLTVVSDLLDAGVNSDA